MGAVEVESADALVRIRMTTLDTHDHRARPAAEKRFEPV
jgi:hypothetical protein